ncbi:MAG: hypothetical protein AB8F94_23290 [Saprospiraceae bacterium]
MNYKNCPDWICHHQGIPYDYVYGLTTILVAIPYLALLSMLFKKEQLSLPSKDGCVFFLAAPFGYIIYSTILFFLFAGSENDILSFIGVVSYGPIIISMITIPFSIIGMIIVGFINFEKEEKNEN